MHSRYKARFTLIVLELALLITMGNFQDTNLNTTEDNLVAVGVPSSLNKPSLDDLSVLATSGIPHPDFRGSVTVPGFVDMDYAMIKNVIETVHIDNTFFATDGEFGYSRMTGSTLHARGAIQVNVTVTTLSFQFDLTLSANYSLLVGEAEQDLALNIKNIDDLQIYIESERFKGTARKVEMRLTNINLEEKKSKGLDDLSALATSGIPLPNFRGSVTVLGFVDMDYAMIKNVIERVHINNTIFDTNGDFGYIRMTGLTLHARGAIQVNFTVNPFFFKFHLAFSANYSLLVDEAEQDLTLNIKTEMNIDFPRTKKKLKDLNSLSGSKGCRGTAGKVDLRLTNIILAGDKLEDLNLWITKAIYKDLVGMICLYSSTGSLSELVEGVSSILIWPTIGKLLIARFL